MRRHLLPCVLNWTPLLASWPAHQLPRVNMHCFSYCMFDMLHCMSFHTRHGSRPLAPNHTHASLVSKSYACVHWYPNHTLASTGPQTICTRHWYANHMFASTGFQTICSHPLVFKPYACVTGFEPYTHSPVYWYLTIHELLHPLVSNCMQYALASTDSLIRHRSLLLLCGVSSTACIAGSFISGAQLTRPHSASGRKALQGFCPDSHSCYVHAVVHSMYITRSSL